MLHSGYSKLVQQIESSCESAGRKTMPHVVKDPVPKSHFRADLKSARRKAALGSASPGAMENLS